MWLVTLKVAYKGLKQRTKQMMTKKQVINELKSMCPNCQYNGKKDHVACSQCFNDFTDMLCKDGLITQDQYDNWTNPF